MAFRSPVLPWKQLWGLAAWAGRVKAFAAIWFSPHSPLPVGVLVREEAPAKLIVYLQCFRPQDYQRLLEVYSSKRKPEGTEDLDVRLG